MSCRNTVGDVVGGCVDWARDTSEGCSEDAESNIQVCVERAQEDIEGCDEERAESKKECNDYDWQSCDVPIVCDVAEAFVGWVCAGWTWVTYFVCVAPTLIVAGTCLVWEAIKNLACQIVTTVVRGACELGGALVTAFVCPFVDFVSVRILRSNDEPKAESVPRPFADAMSVAHVASEQSYRDSGRRYFFRIGKGGVAEVSTLDRDWCPIAPDRDGPRSISYRRHRDPLREPVPKFDMIAANSGRVFVKEVCYARFYVAMLEPMFRRAGNVPVPSAYFKLDPEQGQPDADNRDRLVHLEVDNPDAHPASVRFPLFRKLMEIDLVDSMIVNVDNNLRVWHRVDARPPRDGGPPPNGPGFPRRDEVVTYGSSLTRFLPLQILGHEAKLGYRVSRVLDIGVGHEHWHEQRCSIYGGEMDSLDGPGLDPCLKGRHAYRLFNGPVEDQGGFIDNTINYYVLGQFDNREYGDDDDVPREAFGILWLDEQAVLSERWRLLDPADAAFGTFKDLVPSAIVQYLEKDFDIVSFRFDRSKYWCPLRAGHATSRSRMAVSRQVVVLSGRDPKTKNWELYSIHAAFGTWDRTWRWRELPTSKIDGRTPVPEGFGLREDMTLYVRETCPDGARVWFQRYLPATLKAPPDGNDLKLVGNPDKPPERNLGLAKPDEQIEYPWQWLPADVFEFCHRHATHFGCYETSVDWRWQYYRVEVLEGEEFLLGQPEDTRWVDVDRRLSIVQECIDWERLNAALGGEGDVAMSPELLARILVLAASIPGTAVGGLSAAAIEALFGALNQWDGLEGVRDLLCSFYTALRDDGHFIRETHHEGLFNDGFHLRLRRREPFGFVLTHFDKRDDDLLPFRLHGKDGGPVEIVLRPLGASATTPRVVLGLRSHVEVRDIPRVCRAEVTVERGEAGGRLRVRLLPAVGADQVDENLWRLKIGCVQRSQTGAMESFATHFDRTRLSADRRSVEASGWHEYEWELNGGDIEALTACCGAEAWRDSGTSLWFEDIVGHLGTADDATFRVARA